MLKYRFLMTVLTVSFALPPAALAQSGSPAASAAEQQVIQAEKDRFAAMIKADGAALEQLLANDLTYTHTNAMFETKAQFIKSVTGGAIDYVSIVPSEVKLAARMVTAPPWVRIVSPVFMLKLPTPSPSASARIVSDPVVAVKLRILSGRFASVTSLFA